MGSFVDAMQRGFMGAVQSGNALQEMGARQAEIERGNALRQFMMDNGRALMAGDPNALAGYAQFDPQGAMGMQRAQVGLQIDRAQLEQIHAQAKTAAAKAAADMDAATRAQEAQRMNALLASGSAAFRQGPEALSRWAMSNAQVLGQAGIEPGAITPETFPQLAAGAYGAINALEGFEVAKDLTAQPEVKPQFREATPEEAARYGAQAGQFGPDGKFYPFNPPRGQEISVGADGSVRITEGVGVGGKEATIGDVYNPGEVQSTLDLIDSIASNKSLSRVLGPLEGGGGNDVTKMSATQRAYYGEGGLGAIQQINQLQSRAWLAARKMLKGGGQITDYESRKAEAAVARLERAQGEDEFRAALGELRTAITDGMRKLEGAQGGAAQPKAPAQPDGLAEFAARPDVQKMLAENPGVTPEKLFEAYQAQSGQGQFTFENDEQRALFEKYAN